MWTLSRLAAETRSIHGNEKYDWEHSLCLDSTAGENWPWPRGKVPGDQAVSGAQGLPGTQMHKAYMGHPSWDQRSMQKFQRGPPAQDTIGCEFLWNPPPYFSQAGHMSRYPTNRPQTLFLPQWMPHTTEKTFIPRFFLFLEIDVHILTYVPLFLNWPLHQSRAHELW
jgi:hypothetical protein